MSSSSTNISGYKVKWFVRVVVCALFASTFSSAQQSRSKETSQWAPTAVRTFDTPQQASAALIEAADKFDVPALTQIFGPAVEDVIFSGEYAQDRKHASDFATEAREKNSVSVDPKSSARAFLLVGNEDWPFPVPLVKKGAKWSFDTKAGRQELLYRRIGANELDAIEICHGYTDMLRRSMNTLSNRTKATR